MSEQAGRVGNQARVPLGVAIKDITFQDLIHLGPQSKVFRVCSPVAGNVFLTCSMPLSRVPSVSARRSGYRRSD